MQLLCRGSSCSEDVVKAIEGARLVQWSGRTGRAETQRLSLLLPVPPRSCLSDAFETQRPLAYHCDAYVSVARVKCTGAEVVVKAYVRDQLSAGARQQVNCLFNWYSVAAAFSRHIV